MGREGVDANLYEMEGLKWSGMGERSFGWVVPCGLT